MKILVDRKWRKTNYTIGQLYINGVYECDTIEDTDRFHNGGIKIPNETAIPEGTYDISMSVVSNRFGNKEPYKSICKGRVPRICNVPQFDGVLIHIGNTTKDTSGCILVGKNKIKGGVTDSKACFVKLYNKMLVAHERGELITITIK